jgi:hypothetical protein
MSNATPRPTGGTERASVKPTVVETKPKKPARSRMVVVEEEDELGFAEAK